VETYLVRQGGWDIGVGTSNSKEDTKVASSDVVGKTQERYTDEAKSRVEDDESAADLVSVTDPCGAVHEDGGKGIRRSNEALSGTDAESHSLLENLWQEVGNGISDGCRHAKNEGKPPNLWIQGRRKVSFPVEWLRDGILAIAVDAGNHKVNLPGC
jgi:hypothetical protein